MKKYFRRIAAYFVTLYANYIYNRARKTADKRYAEQGTMIYVASETFRPDHLTTYDRWQFKREKRAYGFHARLLTLNTLKNGCWYHTPDTAGNQIMGEGEVIRRQRAFVRQLLRKAKLV